MATGDLYPCPCCGYMVFTEPAGSYDICRVCNWEDDHVQLAFPLSGGANQPLVIRQAEFLSAFSDQQRSELAAQGLARCQDWRPLEARDIEAAGPGPTSGVQYFEAAAAAEPPYYWRRPDLQR